MKRMTFTNNSEAGLSPVSSWLGLGIFAVVVSVYALYAWFLLSNLPAFPMEVRYVGKDADALFSTPWRLLTSVFGTELYQSRHLSFGSGLVAIILMFRIGVVMGKDQVAGAFLALGYILFPPLVALYSLASPQAFISLLGVLALAAIVEPRFSIGIRVRTVVAGTLLSIAVVLAAKAFPLTNVLSKGGESVLETLLLPYAMLWAGLGLSLLALKSPCVRGRLGPLGTRLVWTAPLAALMFCATVFLVAGRSSQLLLSSVANVFGLLLVGVLPLIVWVRFEMPKIRSIIAWIAFPVIMYCGFWLVLGPIQRESFPYNALQGRLGGSSSSILERMP